MKTSLQKFLSLRFILIVFLWSFQAAADKCPPEYVDFQLCADGSVLVHTGGRHWFYVNCEVPITAERVGTHRGGCPIYSIDPGKWKRNP